MGAMETITGQDGNRRPSKMETTARPNSRCRCSFIEVVAVALALVLGRHPERSEGSRSISPTSDLRTFLPLRLLLKDQNSAFTPVALKQRKGPEQGPSPISGISPENREITRPSCVSPPPRIQQ
jgi:hypothetical protein